MKPIISGMTHDAQPFWVNDPTILFDKYHITSVFPRRDDSLAGKLNSMTRFVILLTIIGFIYSHSLKLLLTSIITIMAIVFLYYHKDVPPPRREPMTTMNIVQEIQLPEKSNPLMNVMATDYIEQPDRPPAGPAYHPVIEKEINETAKENIDKKIFRDLGDDLSFEQSMRTFYAMPNTQIPNNQEAFANFCFGDKPSCRGGDYWQCDKPRHTMR
jgi:hypothetical protein